MCSRSHRGFMAKWELGLRLCDSPLQCAPSLVPRRGEKLLQQPIALAWAHVPVQLFHSCGPPALAPQLDVGQP